MSRKLIVNADDFGLTDGCTKGIIKAWREGVVTDTSLLVTTPYWETAVLAATQAGLSACGLHLTLTVGKPVLTQAQVPSLYGPDGQCAKRPAWKAGKAVVLAEVEAEWRAQVQRFLGSGLGLNHLDSHHHIHAWLGADVLALTAQLAKACGVPVRQVDAQSKRCLRQAGVATPDQFSGAFFADGVSRLALTDLALAPWEGVLELMTHPAVFDEETWRISSYCSEREAELALLCDPGVRKAWQAAGIELVSFAALNNKEAEHV